MTSKPGHAPPRGGRVPPTAKSKERGEAPYFAPEAFDTVTIRTYTQGAGFAHVPTLINSSPEGLHVKFKTVSVSSLFYITKKKFIKTKKLV